jgi:hypothetical protein
MAVIRQRLQSPGIIWSSNSIKGILLDEDLPKNSLIRINLVDREILTKEVVKVKYFPANGTLSFSCSFVEVRSSNQMRAVLEKLGFLCVRDFMNVYFFNLQSGNTMLEREFIYYSFNGQSFVC